MLFNQSDYEKLLLKQMGISSEKVLDDWMKKPYHMNSTYKMRFWEIVKSAPAIIIVGDYDVDGVSATYIMAKGIKSIYPKKSLAIRLPKRQSEGYGFNQNIVNEIKEKLPKGSLVITVDNGIAAAVYLEDLKDSGYNVILTDHHELGNNKIPDVDLVLDPKVPTDDIIFDGDYWCGAGVALKLMENMVDPNIENDLATIAGIATIGDCMQLTGGNWALVRKTLDTIKNGTAPKSIYMLLNGLQRDFENINEEILGFYICPALNACGRLIDDGAKIPLQFLLTPTEERCNYIIEKNEERKQLKDIQLAKLEEIIQEENLQNSCPMWVYAPGLHEGIIGILAGQLTEKYHVPAIVLTDSHNEGILKGSARSVPGINIYEYLNSIKEYFCTYEYKDLNTHEMKTGYTFGGHEGAAGLSLPKVNLNQCRKYQLQKPVLSSFTNNILLDITKGDIPLIAKINDVFKPFGEGNPKPYFNLDVNLETENYKYIGVPAIHLQINDPLKKYKILHFNHLPNNLEDKNYFQLTGKINYDVFRGYTTAVLTAETCEDIEVDDREKSK